MKLYEIVQAAERAMDQYTESDNTHTDFVIGLLDDYLAKITNSTGLLIDGDTPRKFVSEVQIICDAITNSVRYLDEHPLDGRAFEKMRQLNLQQKHPDFFTTLLVNQSFYRARPCDKSAEIFKKENLFHIPFDQRERISPQRFRACLRILFCRLRKDKISFVFLLLFLS